MSRNLVRLGFESQDLDLLLDAAEALLADPEADRGWLRGVGARLLLAGRPADGQALLRRVEPDLDLSSGEAAFALYKELDAGAQDDVLADAAWATAYQLWARADVETGAYETAVRLYRQAVQTARHYGPGTDDVPGSDTLLRLELAAALVLSGQVEEAELEVDRARASALHWARLPTWAGQPLVDAGLQVEVVPELQLSAGRQDMKLVGGAGRTESWYALAAWSQQPRPCRLSHRLCSIQENNLCGKPLYGLHTGK